MKDLRQAALGLLAALVSTAILLGSLALALAEGGQQTALLETTPSLVIPRGFPTLTPTPGTTGSPTSPLAQTTSPLTTLTPSQTTLPSLTLTLTLSPSAPALTTTTTPQPVAPVCPLPQGWSTIVVRPGDTLESLADIYNTTPQLLAQANCLVGTTLFPGSHLYVPAPPPVQPTIPCGPPSGWVLGYTVVRGDTLYHIATMFGVTVYQLQLANCMLYSTIINPGERLYVPYVPTNTPVPPAPSPLPTITSTLPPTATQPPVPTRTRTSTPTLPPTLPPTEPPTSTPTAPPTATETPTEVPTSTSTSTLVPSPTEVPPTLTETATTPAGSTSPGN